MDNNKKMEEEELWLLWCGVEWGQGTRELSGSNGGLKSLLLLVSEKLGH